MNRVRDKVEDLRTAILESADYQDFQEVRRRVETVPGLSEKIREFCRKNFELQKNDGETLYELLEEFESQYEGFRRDPVVKTYLERELRMCRMLQEIHERIMGVAADMLI